MQPFDALPPDTRTNRMLSRFRPRRTFDVTEKYGVGSSPLPTGPGPLFVYHCSSSQLHVGLIVSGRAPYVSSVLIISSLVLYPVNGIMEQPGVSYS